MFVSMDVLEVCQVSRLRWFPVRGERLLDCRADHTLGMRSVNLDRRCCFHEMFQRITEYVRRGIATCYPIIDFFDRLLVGSVRSEWWLEVRRDNHSSRDILLLPEKV